ncbi:hypothetical protein CNMCM7691_003363 [Aspergillus felis]|uniref:Uncharacterized protein n=1 Tax=Aspergillus felis TaxID=1287682 RepID=A0A8H6QM31_9EURO|nr:hypothetical protein CNMCM7691_003363 [Aspergillus felis]
MKLLYIFGFFSSAVIASASSCPPPGSSDSQGRYSCNPAHQYPNGQTCQLIDGCNFLATADGGNPIVSPAPGPTAHCPPPGSNDSQGRYSCNPAHQYPNGQTCQLINGCYLLATADGGNDPTSNGPTSDCPPSGSSDSQGRYSCNPAHQYPNGQTCQLINGCYLLTTV